MGLVWQKCLPALIVFVFPFVAQASLFSFVSSLFSYAKAEETIFGNSQNIPLLEASLNTNPSPSLGGADVIIVNGSALLAENSPTGGLSENNKDHPISDQISIYVVREGDTLSTIARMFGVSINTIRWNNDIKGSVISPGQTLTILPVSGIRHTVKSGDTLKSITKMYNGDLEEIKKYNDITENTKLSVGDIVIVPDGEMIAHESVSSSRVSIVGSSKVYEGYYLRPTNGRKTQGIHGYNGVDIGAPIGTPVYASASGRVILAKLGGWNGGYGSYIVIQHPNGTQTLYAHLNDINVSSGQSVNQGDVIGEVGRTGKATGPHLHFEVRGAKNPF